jgi:Rieske Fe-S protein
VLSLSSLIEFLLDMLRDPATQNEYARDPNAALAARGLSNVTAADIHDVQPLLADHTGVSTSAGGAHAAHAAPAYVHSSAGSSYAAHHVVAHDPLPAIQHVTNAYEVDRSMVVRNVTQEYKQYATYKTYLTDNSVHAENGGTVVQDSFNQDNDGVDLKGAKVDDSVLAGHDANDSGNTVTSTTTTEGSYNTDDHAATVTDSHNDSSDHNHSQVSTDSHDSSDSHDSADSHDSVDVNDSYGAHAAHADPVDDGADVPAHHG